MRILLIPFLALFVLAAVPVQAQKLSKEEKKELKALVNKYKKDPQALEELVESVDTYRDENNQLQSQVSSLTSEKQMMETRLTQLEQSNMALNSQLAAAQETAQELTAQQDEMGQSTAYQQDLAGTLFRVQIGAYRKTHIPDDLDTPDGSMTLENAEGMQKVMVGSFREYQSAKDLMGHMKKIGLDGAWVVAYMDGARVSLNDVVPREYQ